MNDNDSAYLLGIGDFSRFTMLSVRMLRHYDERGLLVPAHIDPWNGYRYYSPAQLRTAGRIRALRDAGCGISQIAELLPLFDDADALRIALVEHARSLDAAAQKIADQQAFLASINLKEPTMSIIVDTRVVPAMTVLALRRTVADYHAEAGLWAEFSDLLKSPAGPGMSQFGKRFGTTYYDPDYQETDVDMAVWAELTGPYDPPEPFAVVQIGEQRVAYATLYGPYEGTGAVCEAIGAWMTTQGLTVGGPMFNINIVSPAQDPNPENWVTEINYPIAA